MNSERELDREASIIVATHNRSELLEFTLLSLYEQSVPPGTFEVVVVDDASTDGTAESAMAMRPPYRLKVLRNDVNRGAAYSRNQGIKASQGRIVILLDEMLAGKNYVGGHLKYHRNERMVVTTSFNALYIYTHLYPDFSPGQRMETWWLAQSPGPNARVMPKPDGTQAVRLFYPEQIKTHRLAHHVRTSQPILQTFHSLQAAYGDTLERMTAPWFMMVTNSASVSREMLEQVGMFDEAFQGAWLEDWELGYRLHKAGAIIRNAPDITCYHQAHPEGAACRQENYLRFANKHPVPEVQLVAAMGPPLFWSLEQWGKAVTQFREVVASRGDDLREWTLAFQYLAAILPRTVAENLAGKSHPYLKTAEAGYDRWKPAFAERVREQTALLHQEALSSGGCWELLGAFTGLLRLPLL